MSVWVYVQSRVCMHSHTHLPLTFPPPPTLVDPDKHTNTNTHKNTHTQHDTAQEKGAQICVDDRCLNRATMTECLRCSKTACANQRLRCVGLPLFVYIDGRVWVWVWVCERAAI